MIRSTVHLLNDLMNESFFIVFLHGATHTYTKGSSFAEVYILYFSNTMIDESDNEMMESKSVHI